MNCTRIFVLRGHKKFFLMCAGITVLREYKNFIDFFIKCARIFVLREKKIF